MNKRKEWIGLALVLVLVTILCFYFGVQKKGYHVDEMYSYGLANSNYQPFPHMGDTGAYDVEDFMMEYGAGNNLFDLCSNLWKDVVILSKAELKFKSTEIYEAYKTAQQTSYDTTTTSWLTGDYFKEYLTVEKGTGFNLFSVYMNQRGDVHPPLYYLLLHAVCSFFPGVFSKWFGFAVNYIALMATLILLYRMIRNYVGNYIMAISSTLLYGISAGFISTLVFFRMYAVLTAFTIAFCYFHLYLRDHHWELTGKRKSGLVILVFLGYYTQYFFVVYAGIVMIVACVQMMLSHKAAKIWTYIRQYIWAAVIGVIVWPFSINHIFFGYRGTGVRNSLLNISNLFNATKNMLYRMADASFGGSWIFMFLILVAALIIGVLCLLRRRPDAKKDIGKYILIFLPIMAYFVLVSLASPMISDRYIMNVMPYMSVLIVLVITFMIGFITKARIRKIVYTVIMTASLVFTCALIQKPGYVEGSSQEDVTVPEHTVCVYVMPEGNWAEYTKDILILSKCEDVVILYESNLEFLKSFQYEDGQSVMIYLSYEVDQAEDLNRILEYMGVETLHQTYKTVDTSYYLRYLYQEED